MLLAFLSRALVSLSDADRERDTEGKCFSLWRRQRFTPLTHLAWIGPEPCCGPSNTCLITIERKLMAAALAQLELLITAPPPPVAQVSSCWMPCSRLCQPPEEETVGLYQVPRRKKCTSTRPQVKYFSPCQSQMGTITHNNT